MKNLSSRSFVSSFLLTALLGLNFLLIPSSFAGDCSKRKTINWQATIKSAVNIRDNCPEGNVVGVAPKGEAVSLLEVDYHGDFYKIRSSKGEGFIYKSFLENIKETALFIPPPSPFSDLKSDHQYYQAILDVKEKGIVNGTPEGKIFADKAINRVELAKILIEATEDKDAIKKAFYQPDTFSDVDESAWYIPYLQLAKEKGILTGDAIPSRRSRQKPRVRPGDNANGAEVAKMITIAFKLSVESNENKAWYEAYMDVLKTKNALPFDNPDHKVTRGEMMFMIYQILKP